MVVCPFNRFNRLYLQQLNVSDELAQYLELSFHFPTVHPIQRPKFTHAWQNLDALEIELQDTLGRIGNITFREFIKQVAHIGG